MFGTHRALAHTFLLAWVQLAWAGVLCLGLTSGADAASGLISIQSGGVTRNAILVEHARLKKTSRPLIVILHTGSRTARSYRHILALEDKVRSARPVLVYPEAEANGWSDASKPGETRDTVFIRELINKLENEGIADRRHIFILGSSSGALTALKLACSGADFAGVVALFASVPVNLAASCKPAHPMPILFLLGTSDPVVPYNGGPANLVDSKAELLPARDSLTLFAKAAQCSDDHTTTAFPDHDTRDNSRAYLDKWSGCKAPVELLRVEGGGHLLPRSGSVGVGLRATESERGRDSGRRNRDIDSVGVIWDFLRRLGA
jgi:polyhydroxybutyrate depolymerase